jgi:hypothetical protein
MADIAMRIVDEDGRPIRGSLVRFTAGPASAIPDEATDTNGMIRTVFPDGLVGREIEVWLGEKRLGSFKVRDGIEVMF